MAITPKPKAKPTVDIDAFISGAPDAPALATKHTTHKPAEKTVRKSGKKNIITVSIDPTVLDELDTYAAEMGMSRAAVITFAVKRLMSA